MSKNNFNEVIIVHQALKYPAEFLEDFRRADSRWKAPELRIPEALLKALVKKAVSLVAANTHREKDADQRYLRSDI